MSFNRLKKCLAVGIILLFVGTCIFPVIAQNTQKPSQPASRGNWLYVGGSGPGNYSKIQDAVDNATDGDTVFVYDDSSPYYENIMVNKRISLIGENKETTIIDGNGGDYAVFLTKNSTSVIINGFTIRNPLGYQYNIGIRIEGPHNVISGNRIENTHDGININYLAYFSVNNTIVDNTITHADCGISLFISAQNKIYENQIEDNELGLCVYGWSYTSKKPLFLDEDKNDIYKNTLINNDIGIIIYNYGFVNLSQNIITNNSYGIDLEVGYYGGCINNTITQNKINGNEHGLYMYVWHKDCGGIAYNNIVENNFTYNKKGIEMISVRTGRIGYNTFVHNNFIGNIENAYLEDSFSNHWVGNYWGAARTLPYPIIGKLIIWRFTIPWIIFDWRPAQEPYDIGG
jgi:parallel beta-helix repeat protein